MNRVVCISHRGDVDGVSAAALIKRVSGAEVCLVNYSTFISILKSLSGVDELYLCDLGLSKRTEGDFLVEVGRISSEAEVHYIDHHPLSSGVKQQLTELGVDLSHSVEECTSILTLQKLRLTEVGAKLLAAYGAVTDHMDQQPHARRIIDAFDRQLVLLEATLLAYAVAKRNDDAQFLARVVDELAELSPPHGIEGVVESARDQVERVFELFEVVSRQGVRMKRYAYVESPESSTGIVANLVLGALDVDVGLAYRVKKDEGVVDVSLRGSESCSRDLGDVLSKVADRVGGFGGGHSKASGARIPLSSLHEFLSVLDEEI